LPCFAGRPEDHHGAVGGGHFWSFPCVYLAQPKRGSFFCPLGAAAVGTSLPFGAGVGMADTRRRYKATAAC
jgi:hypothetical protein